MAGNNGRNLFILAIGVAAAIAGVVFSKQQQEVREGMEPSAAVQEQAPPLVLLKKGDPMPAFSLQDLAGQSRSGTDWSGNVVVVNFWATWCPPCLAEIPMFIGYQASHGDQGLQFIGIAIDDPQRVREFVGDMGMNYPVLLGGEDGAALSARFGNHMGALPYTVVFDRDGIARHLIAGRLEADQMEALVLPLL